MKKLLLILAAISFALPILYFNWVYYVAVYSIPPNEFFPRQNYFIEMFNILRHWTSGEMGWFPIYPAIFGVICLVIPFVADEISFYRWKRMNCGGWVDEDSTS